jgi:transcriptional regulator with XRE-family HTH domain
MRLSNELFAKALDWLYANGKVKDQKELAAKTGITETTISRILNDKVKKPSEDTLRKLNNAFGGIFNMEYFRGKNIHMIADDALQAKAEKHLQDIPKPIDYTFLIEKAVEKATAFADRTIASQERQLAEKDATIKEKNAQIKKLEDEKRALEERNRILDERIRELEALNNEKSIFNSPFPIGVADDRTSKQL